MLTILTEALQACHTPMVEDAVKAMIQGDLQRFTREFTCSGGQGHH